MGCSGSSAIGPSALFTKAPVKVNAGLKEGDANYHKRVGTKPKPGDKKCMYCSKEGTMMSPLKICDCCDKWACGACQKKYNYVSSVLPVPATCEFNTARAGSNANQSNFKMVCGSCHNNCAMKTVKAFAAATIPLILAKNEDFKKKILELNKELPLPVADTAEARRKLLIEMNGIKALSKKQIYIIYCSTFCDLFFLRQKRSQKLLQYAVNLVSYK